jgi:hypothetical protein
MKQMDNCVLLALSTNSWSRRTGRATRESLRYFWTWARTAHLGVQLEGKSTPQENLCDKMYKAPLLFTLLPACFTENWEMSYSFIAPLNR